MVEEKEVGRIRTEIDLPDMNSPVAEIDPTGLTVPIKWSEGIVPNDRSVEIALSDLTIPAVGAIDRLDTLPACLVRIQAYSTKARSPFRFSLRSLYPCSHFAI
ncbi:MAG: hypothetical protein ACXWWF_06390 [Nitrospira sp.]